MKKLIIASLFLAPGMVFAQNLTGLDTFLTNIGNLISTALPILVALALLAFFWGLVKYIFAQGNEEAKVDGKKVMIWAVVALFVMVSVWGIVNFVGLQLGIEQGNDGLNIPSVPIP